MAFRPPPRPNRRRAPVAAAARRARDYRTTSLPLKERQSRTPDTRTKYKPALQGWSGARSDPGTRYSVDHTAQNKLAEQVAQRATGRKPAPRTLGSAHHLGEKFTSDTMTGQTGVNRGASGQNVFTAPQATSRVGKKFQVGFTPEGKIVHLYGGDVAAGSRRVVTDAPVNPAMRRSAQRRARVTRL